MSKQNEVYAAIAMALHEHQGNNKHDVESGKITITRRDSEWLDRALVMRHMA